MENIEQNRNSDNSNSDKLLMFDKIERNDNSIDSKEEEIKLEIDINLRQKFILKAYNILFIQLIIIFFFTLIFVSLESFIKFMTTIPGVILFMFLMIISSIIIIHYSEIMKFSPQKYIIFFVFTISESYVIGYIYVYLNLTILFFAVFIAYGFMVLITFYTKKTNIDIDFKRGMFKLLFLILFLFFIFFIFTSYNIKNLFISLLVILFYFFYLINDIKTISEDKIYTILVDYFILFINLYNILRFFTK